MTLPLSMVLQNVVVVATGDQFWGLPEASIEAAMPLAGRDQCHRQRSGGQVPEPGDPLCLTGQVNGGVWRRR